MAVGQEPEVDTQPRGSSVWASGPREAVESPHPRANEHPADWVESPRAESKKKAARSRFGPRRVILPAILLLAVAAAYLAARQFGSPSNDAAAELFTVSRRSFPVILQQKGELKAAKQIDIRCELQGRSTIIKLVEEGKSVRKGDLLVELASDEIEEKVREAESKELLARAALEATEKELQILKDKNHSELSKAKVKLSLATQALNKYREGDAIQAEQEKQLAVDEAAYNLRRAEATLADTEDLFKEGFVTRLEVENERATVYQNRIKLQNAELALQVLKKFTIPMEILQKESDLADAAKELEWKQKEAAASEAKLTAELEAKRGDHKLAKDKLAQMIDQKNKTRILAPADGLVVYFKEHWWDESDMIKTGAQVHEQRVLIQLPDTTSMKVVVRVHEAKAKTLKEGLPAMLQIEGLRDRQFTGRVSKIAVLADSKNSWLNPNIKEYETEVLLDGTHEELKPGLTAHVQIKLADLHDVLAVPVQSVFGKGSRFYVFTRDHAGIKPVEVKLGMASTEFVEITQGLQPGDQVLLAVPDEAKLLLPEDSEATKTATWSASQPASAPASQPASTPASGPAVE
ncbi:MAG TPA: HlyD family efflux transporter periplasmic adaptor subunit [Phycisphaerae bacterium]|nr:HlyD family efflux transporter periplasmic adaptor subunit [Phycisphaerae bacterium]HON65752.1 HlyD family efflux transporter periplasmic adaptor subunit [Phycisphaerae bacterium]HQE26164.1 HlyD family efflux transporter periplasmic adaptor subunit [Phycisphaerae bacterium]